MNTRINYNDRLGALFLIKKFEKLCLNFKECDGYFMVNITPVKAWEIGLI